MKPKLLVLIAAIIGIAVLFTASCRKSDIQKKHADTFNEKAAKEWWYGTFRKSAEYSRVDYASIFAPPAGNNAASKKYPSWKRAQSFKIGNTEVVEMPLVYNFWSIIFPGASRYSAIEKKKTAAASLQRLVMVRGRDKKIKLRTVSLIPTPEYAKANNFDISKNTVTKLDPSFNGWMVVKGWNETVVNFWEIKNGKRVKKIKIVPAAAAARSSEFVCWDEPTVESTSSICVGYTCGDEPCEAEGNDGQCDNWIININLGSQLQCEYQPGDEEEDPWGDCMGGLRCRRLPLPGIGNM